MTYRTPAARCRFPAWLAVAAALALWAARGATAATPPAPGADGEALPPFLQPIDLRPDALGDYGWPISTASPQAQAYFDQGMQLRWAYSVDDAARSMAEARRRDPTCAMCFWGEAFALGSFLNAGMSVEKARYAHEAIEKAVALAGGASEKERALIMAARVRYPADYDPAQRRPVDEAFAAQMAEVYASYPDDHDVATVYAVALFLLEERRGYRDLADPDVVRLHRVLRGVLDEDIRHPGACHLYIHATESTSAPVLGLPCAEHLAAAVPRASHIQHMPSHTYNRLGDWGAAVRANIRAWHADLLAAQGRGFSYGAGHNLHMLLFAASYDGQGALAMQAGRDFARATGNPMYQVLTLVRFGRFDEILALDNRPEEGVAGAMWDFGAGYARLRDGDFEAAERSLDAVKAFVSTTDAKFRFHPASRVVGTVARLLEGEIHRARGDLDAAIAAFEAAVALEDALDYDEPEPLPFAARHWLGAAQLEAERYAAAERTYLAELADHPRNGWSLHGLRAALAGQGKADAAVDAALEDSWARADTLLSASRF
jgi:tetratricopeptide (TPR) repeat protein